MTAHTALSVKKFLAEKQIPTHDYPLYSLDLAPCDFILFPKVKSILYGTSSGLKRTRFDSVKEIKKKTMKLLRHLVEKDLLHCFDQWKIQNEGCVDAQREYTKGETK